MWGWGLIIKWGEGAMIFMFLVLAEMVTYITFGTDVFSIRKNVRK